MFCGKCGSKLDDDSLFCANCGSQSNAVANNAQPRFCGSCGGRLVAGARFCYICGSETASVISGDTFSTEGLLLRQLTNKLWAEIIAWCIIIFAQLAVSIALLAQSVTENGFYGIACAVCAVLNIKSVYDDYTFLNQIKNRPAGIVARYESMPDFWFAFLWSATRGMGIGLVAWIFSMLTRSFVLDNKQGFLELEKQYIN